LKQVLGKVILSCHTTLIQGRQVLDGVVVVLNELIDLIKKNEKSACF